MSPERDKEINTRTNTQAVRGKIIGTHSVLFRKAKATLLTKWDDIDTETLFQAHRGH